MSWNQLLSIIEEAHEIDREQATRIPVDCPVCGNVLSAGPEGVQLFCSSDGWQYPRDA